MKKKIAQNSVGEEVCLPAKETERGGTASRVREYSEVSRDKEVRENSKAEGMRNCVRRWKNSWIAGAVAGLLVSLLFSIHLFAQTVEIKPLQLGEKVPSAVLESRMPVLINFGSNRDSIRIKDFTGKIILLDFWASWCSTCISKLPHLSALQSRFKDDLVILLVNSNNTKDNLEKLTEKLDGNKAYSKTDLISIYNDDRLSALFPHLMLPHYIWIGRNGHVKGITFSETVNAETVIEMIKEKLKVKSPSKSRI